MSYWPVEDPVYDQSKSRAENYQYLRSLFERDIAEAMIRYPKENNRETLKDTAKYNIEHRRYKGAHTETNYTEALRDLIELGIVKVPITDFDVVFVEWELGTLLNINSNHKLTKALFDWDGGNEEDLKKPSPPYANLWCRKNHEAWSTHICVRTCTEINSEGLKMRKNCIAFKMNYCDGGASSERVGFNGICSTENIFHNIRKAKRRWCSSDRCACKKYLDGRNFLPDEFICYERTLLKDWRVKVGEDLDGTPRKICGGEENHLCVLTTKYPDTAEIKRFVFALFLIKKIFVGNNEHSGCVYAEDYFRLEFRPHEAAQIKFWDVYQNLNAPQKKFWGSGLFRYFDDATAVKFLERAVEVKRDTPEEKFSEKFLHHYKKFAKERAK